MPGIQIGYSTRDQAHINIRGVGAEPRYRRSYQVQSKTWICSLQNLELKMSSTHAHTCIDKIFSPERINTNTAKDTFSFCTFLRSVGSRRIGPTPFATEDPICFRLVVWSVQLSLQPDAIALESDLAA